MSRVVVCLLLTLIPGVSRGQYGGWLEAGLGGGYYAFASSPTGALYCATFNDGSPAQNRISRSMDDGITWTQLAMNEQVPAAISLVCDGARMYAGSARGLFVSNDGGVTWSQVTGVPSYRVDGVAVCGSNVIAITDSGIYATSDRTNWTLRYSSSVLRSWAQPAVAGDTIYWAAALGVVASTDAGMTWTVIDSAHSFLSMSASGGDLFAGGSNEGIYRSSDRGHSWRRTTDPNSAPPFGLAALGSYLFASQIGNETTDIFVSRDMGTTWQLINASQPHRVQIVVAHRSNLLAASWNVGLWYRPIADIIQSLGVEEGSRDGVSVSWRVAGGRTSLDIDLARGDRPVVRVYDVLGREIMRHDCGALSAGRHEVDLVPEFPIGPHFVRLDLDSGAKMVRVMK